MTAPRTLLANLAERAAHDPEGEAFLFANQAATYGELWQAVVRCGGSLLARGVEPGEPVVLSLANGPEFFAAFYGIERAGGVPVPVHPGSGAARLASLARRCGARRAVVANLDTPGTATGSADRPKEADELDAKTSAVEFLTVGALLGGTTGREQRDLGPPEVGPDDLAYIQYTSGSTGEPKGVRLTHRAVLANLRQLIAGFDITPAEVFVSWLPAYHDMGLVLMTMVPFALGARLVLLPATLRSLRPWLLAIERERGTFTAAPDFGYRMALRIMRNRELPDLSSLRVALNAAEPVRTATIEAFEGAFGLDAVMIAGYGLAEATVGVAAWPPGRSPLADGEGNVSVGPPFPDVEIAILGEDGLLPAGRCGEILVRSPAATRGYVGEPEGEGPLFWRDGFLRTGDIGYQDEAGNLFVAGRVKHMILQAGRNIAPREVEEIADGLPFVRRSAAFGVDRGDAAGEQLYVLAELRAATKPDEVTCREQVIAVVDAIHAHLGMRPGRVYLAAPRTIPLTPNGKIRYGELGEICRSGRPWYPTW